MNIVIRIQYLKDKTSCLHFGGKTVFFKCTKNPLKIRLKYTYMWDTKKTPNYFFFMNKNEYLQRCGVHNVFVLLFLLTLEQIIRGNLVFDYFFYVLIGQRKSKSANVHCERNLKAIKKYIFILQVPHLVLIHPFSLSSLQQSANWKTKEGTTDAQYQR